MDDVAQRSLGNSAKEKCYIIIIIIIAVIIIIIIINIISWYDVLSDYFRMG